MRKNCPRLKSLDDCRRFLARKILDFDKGELSETNLRAFSYGINVLVSIIKDSALEARVTELENLARGGNA